MIEKEWNPRRYFNFQSKNKSHNHKSQYGGQSYS